MNAIPNGVIWAFSNLVLWAVILIVYYGIFFLAIWAIFWGIAKVISAVVAGLRYDYRR